MRKKVLTLSPDAIDALMAHPWRGNVRELQNCIERAVLLTEGHAIHARHLNLASQADMPPAPARAGAIALDGLDLSGTLAEASRRIVAEVERRKKIGRAHV